MKANKKLLVIVLFLFSCIRPLKTQEITVKTDYSQLEEYVKNEKNLVKLGKYQEAILELEEKLILQPDNPVILSLLGKSYEKLNKREKSIDYLTKAITVDRNYPKSFNTLALIKGKQNKFQETINLLDAAIKKSDLGLNPQIDGQLIRLPIPELNEERRSELKKLIKSIGEKCKVSIRNIRREANEELKKLLKSKEIGEDEEKSFEKNVQVITDKHIAIVDEKISTKEKEIMTI